MSRHLLEKVLFLGNDRAATRVYSRRMAQPRHDWYLRDWLKALGVTQQWVADQLHVQKSKVSRKASGVTAYDRDDVNTFAALLHLSPFELLLHPDEAHHIRRLRSVAAEEYRLRAAEERASFIPAAPPSDRLVPRKTG